MREGKHVPWLGVVLRELDLSFSDDVGIAVKDDEPRRAEA